MKKKDKSEEKKEYKPKKTAENKKYKAERSVEKAKKYDKSYYWGFALRVFYRIILVAVTLVLLASFGVYYTVNTIAHGPSETVRNTLVQMALQSSAAKWIPNLFLTQEEIDAIMKKSEEKVIEEVDVTPVNTGDVTGPVYIPDDRT